ncbi:hypothetical protein [Streptomyces sp. H34-S4]|uniref:hypothetical protein n=1 Tax=Streptomyces sp. H34-S4 TaxID=2996463 RepID=UPI00226D98AA|nr:hypothetical protein [Streptomyces sp. H34-S4]MCY0936848.1 hypothetical protein [Streptomyces sp. H34-S4]
MQMPGEQVPPVDHLTVAAEAGAEQLELAQRLLEQGRLDQAEHWLRVAAADAGRSVALQGARKLARLLTDQGREDEAAQWHRRVEEMETENRLLGSSLPPPVYSGRMAEAALTVLVATAVLPFVQVLVSKVAEDAYAQARQLIRRLPLGRQESRSAGNPAGPSGQPQARFVIVDDPDAGITLYLSSEMSDEALRALAAFDLDELTARRPDAGRVRLIWHQESGTWRIRGEAGQPPALPSP